MQAALVNAFNDLQCSVPPGNILYVYCKPQCALSVEQIYAETAAEVHYNQLCAKHIDLMLSVEHVALFHVKLESAAFMRWKTSPSHSCTPPQCNRRLSHHR